MLLKQTKKERKPSIRIGSSLQTAVTNLPTYRRICHRKTSRNPHQLNHCQLPVSHPRGKQ